MATIYLCSQQDVIDRFGGPSALAQCLDPGGTGSIDTALLDRARADASGDCLKSAGNKFSTGQIDPNDPPQWLIRIAAQRSVYYCWIYGSHGKAVPENVKQIYESTTQELQRLEDNRTGVGPTQPQDRTTIRPIDNSDYGRRMTLSVWRRGDWM